MVAVIAAHLDHHDPEVVRVAARQPAAAGEVPTAVADRLAAVLDHDDREVRAWATITLAHRGDARAVASLAGPCRLPNEQAARALGTIGPAAALAAPLIDVTKPVGLWARWRITGERTAETAAALAARETAESMRLLAELGPAAAPTSRRSANSCPESMMGFASRRQALCGERPAIQPRP
jgi:hypothetical protein